MKREAKCIVECKNILGEAPVWDIQEQSLYWVDIEGKVLQRLISESQEISKWEMPERIGSFALREKGGLIVAFESGIALVDLAPFKIEWIAKPEPPQLQTRFNEGKCDRKGRFWVGSMDDTLKNHTGALYRVDPDLSVHQIFDNVGISNCFIWSLENDRFWFADSMDKCIYDYDYSHETGTLSNRNIFVDLNKEGYAPDGGTIDTEGYIWNAQFAGSRIVRYSPNAQIDDIIDLPVSQPTSCMFGGKDLKTLYITTATFAMTELELKNQPLAGNLFAIDLEIGGIPEPRFVG